MGAAEAYIPLEQGALATQGSAWRPEGRSVQIMPHHQRRLMQKASSHNATSASGDIQWGKWNQEIPTGGPCLYGFRESILLPHQSSSRPDTYLNHCGRTTDPKRKKQFFKVMFREKAPYLAQKHCISWYFHKTSLWKIAISIKLIGIFKNDLRLPE